MTLPTERLAECRQCQENQADRREPVLHPASPEHDRRQDAHDREHCTCPLMDPADSDCPQHGLEAWQRGPGAPCECEPSLGRQGDCGGVCAPAPPAEGGG